MIKMNVKILFEEGLHARPASQLVNTLKNVKSEVELIKEGHSINPKSILGVLSLGVSHGDHVEIIIDGEDEQSLSQELKSFFELA